MFIILISGYKRSGKDFMAQELSKLIPNSKVLSFAEPLKDIIATTMGISKDELDKFKNNNTPVLTECREITNFRSILQQFGTEAMHKHFGKDVWVQLMVDKITADVENEVFIIPDWRYETEIDILSKIGTVKTIRVLDFNIIPDDHISERALDNYACDRYIDNTVKCGAFKAPLKCFAREILTK